MHYSYYHSIFAVSGIVMHLERVEIMWTGCMDSVQIPFYIRDLSILERSVTLMS